ncbi:hypothetical protein HKD37_06G014951 [Glycine soja]
MLPLQPFFFLLSIISHHFLAALEFTTLTHIKPKLNGEDLTLFSDRMRYISLQTGFETLNFLQVVRDKDDRYLAIVADRSSEMFPTALNKERVQEMENESIIQSNNNTNTMSSVREKNGGDGSLLLRANSDSARQATTSDLVLQWGNRKRLRCMKVQVKDDSSGPVQRTTVRVDRRVVRTDKDSLNKLTFGVNNNNHHHQSNGYPNLRQRPSSPQPRILRNSESSSAMRGGQSNGGVSVRGIASPDRGAHDKRGTHNDNNKSAASSDTAHDSKKGGSPSGSGDAAAPPVWPPKFVIALTNKEKEEDFLAIKGSKLPQRPKKRAKFIQRTLNLVSPGAWLCDLTLERYEVREKKISKKQRPRGLKAMGNMDSDSE